MSPFFVGLCVLAAILALYGLLWLLNAVIVVLTSPWFWGVVVPVGAVGLVGFFWRRLQQ